MGSQTPVKSFLGNQGIRRKSFRWIKFIFTVGKYLTPRTLIMGPSMWVPMSGKPINTNLSLRDEPLLDVLTNTVFLVLPEATPRWVHPMTRCFLWDPSITWQLLSVQMQNIDPRLALLPFTVKGSDGLVTHSYTESFSSLEDHMWVTHSPFFFGTWFHFKSQRMTNLNF